MQATKRILIDRDTARSLLPLRAENSNKYDFGKALLITGSDKYEGAGRLSLAASLRGGAGITTLISTERLRDRLITDFPEAIYAPLLDNMEENRERILALAESHTSILVGCGSGVSEELYRLLRALLLCDGAPIVIDADGINSLARFGSPEDIRQARRRVILTPHIMEFSRLAGRSAEYINSHREQAAECFAEDTGSVILLKGKNTVITDGSLTYINMTGSSALSKGGSGDVLAGLLVSLLAFMPSPIEAAALSAYLHGKAGDALSNIYSDFGVTPSELPKEIAKTIRSLIY